MYALGIDVGTGGTRALIIDARRTHRRVGDGRARTVRITTNWLGRAIIPKTGGAPAALAVRKALSESGLRATTSRASAFRDRCTAP